ncbi:MAG: response regulator [Clostridia bacterium]|jgi:two-component system, response regulator YesN|nr:response regulator [Clostridia bacterium]
MYKMLIADDEALERRAFRTIVEKDVELISEVIEAQNGNEAVLQAQTHKPDIIVMDVKMPGINGIEAIKQIKQSGLDAHFIVLTAYDDFNYIQEAMKMGVDDYLLKPSRRVKIVDSLNKVARIIKTERKKAGLNMTMLKKIDKIRPAVENQLVSLVMFGGSGNLEIKSCLDFIGIQNSRGYVLIVSLDIDSKLEDNTAKYLLNKEVYDYLYRLVHDSAVAVVGMPYSGNITAIIFDDDRRMEQELIEKIQHQFERSFSVGTGGFFEDRPQMERSYYQALQALRSAVYGNEKLVTFSEDAAISDYTIRYLAGKEEVLIQRFKTLNKVECIDTIDEMFLWIFKNMSTDIGIARNYVMGMVALIIKTAAGMVVGRKTEEQFLSRDYYGEITIIDDLWKLKKWFERMLAEVLDSVKETQSKKQVRVIELAKDYIEKHAASDLTLERISAELNISQTHFSRIFKSQVGVSFVDYLTQVRIDNAKELMKTTDMSFKQICFKVGFNDPNYFSKVFKKVVGITPGDYKSNLG